MLLPLGRDGQKLSQRMRSRKSKVRMSDIERPSTSARLLVQSPAPSNPPAVQGSIVPITGVQAKPTDKGVEVILQTTGGEQLQITNRSAENNFMENNCKSLIAVLRITLSLIFLMLNCVYPMVMVSHSVPKNQLWELLR